MLPANFGNPLWFSDDDLQELRGTTLFRATELQVVYLLIDHLITTNHFNKTYASLANLRTYRDLELMNFWQIGRRHFMSMFKFQIS